ncbi:hypothetical protein PsYK624_141910 [Phanerochaete sordida]|uniref:Secreted protein n=1 Tax=Phanerochaete sordida TaxID=48140 RepID=A0A9P3GR85_9APHY|nr:hypothetical protein PsYK624_141910 [Phanerochaete sordida]
MFLLAFPTSILPPLALSPALSQPYAFAGHFGGLGHRPAVDDVPRPCNPPSNLRGLHPAVQHNLRAPREHLITRSCSRTSRMRPLSTACCCRTVHNLTTEGVASRRH